MDKSIIDACTWWLTWNKWCFCDSGIDEAMFIQIVQLFVFQRKKKNSLCTSLSIQNDRRWRLIRTMTIETCPKEREDTSIFWTNNHIVFIRFLTWSYVCMTIVNTMWCALVYNVYEAFSQICTLFSLSFLSLSLSITYHYVKKICLYTYMCHFH
jgi:hypothetical protein